MRALRIHAWGGPLAAEEVPAPRPGPGELLVRVEACAIGLTVANCIRGDLGSDPAGLPRIPGHELVGRVVDAGDAAGAARVGERVMAYFYDVCGSCDLCLRGEESLCRRFAGFLGVHRDGGFAELALLPERMAIGLPEAIPAAAAAAIPDAIATPVHVAGRAAIVEGERVAVIAAGGGVGIHMVQVATARGARVAALDASPPKLAVLRRELGVAAVDSSDFSAVELPADWDGRADVVVDLLGTRASLEWGAGALDRNGRLVVLTTFPGVDFTADPRSLVLGQTSIVGSRYASRAELTEAAQLVESGAVRPYVTHVTEAEGVADALAAVVRGEVVGRGALLWKPSARRL